MLLHFFVHRRKSCTFVPSKTERFMDRIRLKDKEFELFITGVGYSGGYR